MKKLILTILFPVLLLVVLIKFDALPIADHEKLTVRVEEASFTSTSYSNGAAEKDADPVASVTKPKYYTTSAKNGQIINYAMTLLGSPYLFGGTTPNGFDCSGFITHVFDENGVKVKRSSGLQATEGIQVDRSEAAPGDLVIFTGTDESVREPGHVGIVISEPGDTIEFIHSSSSRREGGVKISQVEGSGYEDRFLEVRRVL